MGCGLGLLGPPQISSLLQETYRRVHISIEKIADNLAGFILGITSIII